MATPKALLAAPLLILLVGTCTPARLEAQEPTPAPAAPVFERLDGLSHNTVFSLLQDRQGFLWIGTSDGLNRYDGYEFTVYRHHPEDSTSLSNNTVKALLEDRAGNLWIGTDGGLDRFDRRTGRFLRYLAYGVLSLLEDGRGYLWIGTGNGLYRYERDTDRFKAYRHEPDDPNSLAGDNVWSLYEGRSRTLWISTQGQAPQRYDPDADHFVRSALPQASGFVSLLYEDEASRLWLSGETETGAFDPADGRLTALPGLPAGRLLHVVLEDRRGIRWMGTDDGLHRYDPATGERVHFRVEASAGAHLQNSVKTLYEDRAGTLWVGTFSGLYRRDPHVKPFHHLGYDPADPNSLGSSTVMAVRETADGFLWIGTLGGGLSRLDRRTGTVARYRHQPGNASSLCHDLIWSLFEDRAGRLWTGTDAGLCALDPRTGRFTRYDLPLDAPATKQPPVNAVREDRAGRLWIATNAGLFSLDPASGAATRYSLPGDAQGNHPSSTFFLQTLHLDRTGSLWIGTFGGDLYRLDAGTGEAPDRPAFTRYPLLINRREELVSEGIWAIHEDDDGIFWLGSDFGLTRFDPRTGTARHFTQRDGLPGSIVYGILQDPLLGRLWLSTNHGLARFDDRLPEGRKVRVYDGGDGLLNTEFNRRAAFQAADGTFFFGGLNGLTWFAPTAIHDNLVVPPVVITRIETSNRDTTVVVNPSGLDELVLSYRDYTVSFEFSALNFTNPARNQYRYRLEDFDEGWIEAGTRRFARYTNIPPGSYRFRVIGSNNDGRWNETGDALAITVTPPFWQTWSFRLLVLAALAALLTAAYRYRVARLLEVERIRLRIAGDLHDDIGSNLSSIALLSDMVQGRERLDERERRQLSKISRSARDMVEALRDIVWSIDPEADRVDDLVRRMKDTAASLLGETRWRFRGPADGLAGTLDMDVRRHLFLCYKEMLHNVARHARATEVTIRLEETGGALRLTVADDGDGFDPSPARQGNGLKNLQQRASRIGGTLEIRSEPGRGTTIRLTVPRKHAPRRSKTT